MRLEKAFLDFLVTHTGISSDVFLHMEESEINELRGMTIEELSEWASVIKQTYPWVCNENRWEAPPLFSFVSEVIYSEEENVGEFVLTNGDLSWLQTCGISA